jgi:hypothetical protein
MKNTQLAQICVLLISKVKVTYVILTEKFWGTFWAIFRQTHLVTLGKSFGGKWRIFLPEEFLWPGSAITVRISIPI